MAYENIEIEYANFTIGPTGATIFTMDHTTNTVIEKDLSGSVVFNYLTDTGFVEVESMQFDGYYFWSLERQGETGFRVRKWEVSSSNVFELVDEFAYISDVINKYDVNAFAVEYYADSLDNQEVVGQTTFDVVDGELIQIGDSIVIGPSTAVGYEGLYFKTEVINKVGDTTITVFPALGVTFSPNDPLYYTRAFYVFSDVGPGNLPGALYKFNWETGGTLAVNVSNMFWNVKAATFFQNKIMFVKGGEIIWLSPDSQNIFKSQAIDNINKPRSGYHEAYDLTGFSSTIYRLEQKKTYWNEAFDRWDTEDWDPLFNYNTSSIVPEVYFVAVKAEPPILHRFDSSIATSEIESLITVTVLDQFRTPVFNRIVDLSSTGGPLSSIQETTDENGQVRVTYTANSTVGDVTITATVP